MTEQPVQPAGASRDGRATPDGRQLADSDLTRITGGGDGGPTSAGDRNG